MHTVIIRVPDEWRVEIEAIQKELKDDGSVLSMAEIVRQLIAPEIKARIKKRKENEQKV